MVNEPAVPLLDPHTSTQDDPSWDKMGIIYISKDTTLLFEVKVVISRQHRFDKKGWDKTSTCYCNIALSYLRVMIVVFIVDRFRHICLLFATVPPDVVIHSYLLLYLLTLIEKKKSCYLVFSFVLHSKREKVQNTTKSVRWWVDCPCERKAGLV